MARAKTQFTQTIVPLDMLQEWENNPRACTDADYQRLLYQVKTLGEYKPLICYKRASKYIVLGGNMRLRAYRELGHKSAWVVVVPASSRRKMLEYSLSDNDRVGYYEDSALMKLIADLDISLKQFSIDTTIPNATLDKLVDATNKDFSALDKELKTTKKFADIRITIVIPKQHEQAVKEFLANGYDTNEVGMGKGVLKRCELL